MVKIKIKKAFQYGATIIGVFVLFMVFLSFGNHSAHAEELKEKHIAFPESTTQNQTKTISVPDLINVEGVTIDNGNVDYSLNNTKVNLMVSNGTGKKVQTGGSYTPANTRNQTDSKTSPTNSFPASYTWSKDGYSGTLYKSGSPTILSGHVASSKVIKGYGSTTQGKLGIYKYSAATGKWTYLEDGTQAPWIIQHYNYSDSEGYKGTLNASYDHSGPITYYKLPKNPHDGQTAVYHSYTNYYSYQGTVSRPDTRVWKQNYSGSVTKPAVDTRTYETRYSYNVTLKYDGWDLKLSSTPSEVDLPNVTLNGHKQSVEKTIEKPLTVSDTGETGWHLTISATQFKDEKGHVLPVNSLQMTTPEKIKVKNLSNNEQSKRSSQSKHVSIDGSSHTIASIEHTSQISQYTFDDFKLKLLINPGTTFIDQSDESSNYQSNIIWTLVSGP